MRKPTLEELWAWWEECEEHLANCYDETCELYLSFAKFKEGLDEEL